MIFAISSRAEGTMSLLAPFLIEEGLFRFDIDCFNEYVWSFSRDGFSVEDPDGNRITDKQLSAFYWRKPIFPQMSVPEYGCLENWSREEVKDIFADLFYECEKQKLCALVHPGYRMFRKIEQMKLAARYFPVPDWGVFRGSLPELMRSGNWVFKTLAQTPIGKGKRPFVKSVLPTELDLRYPWFLQNRIDAGDETTVVYVKGRCFSFHMETTAQGILDSRVSMTTPGVMCNWLPTELSNSERQSIRSYMQDAGLEFGRFDFLRTKDGVLWFLELNPNGQWGWLDPRNEQGLLQAIADEILAVSRSGRRLQWS